MGVVPQAAGEGDALRFHHLPPSNNPSPLSRPLGSPHPPLSPAHTAAPGLLHAPLHACSPLSPPWATILHNFALSLSCTLRLRFQLARPSALQLTLSFPGTPCVSFPTLHTPWSLTLLFAHASSGAPSLPPLTPEKSLGPCCRHTWDTLPLTFPQTVRLSRHSHLHSRSTLPSYSCTPAFSLYTPLPPTVARTRASQEPTLSQVLMPPRFAGLPTPLHLSSPNPCPSPSSTLG